MTTDTNGLVAPTPDEELRDRTASTEAGRGRAIARRIIYLSGPITGIPQKNHPLFMMVAGQLRAEGHEVYNPREFTWEGEIFPKRKAFAAYCDFICSRADTIVLLPGWQQSKGATTERGLAENCGLEIIEWARWSLPIVEDVGGGP